MNFFLNLRKNLLWRAIPVAGLAGGAAFLAVGAVLTPLLLQVNGFIVLRYSAALVMGDKALMNPNAVVVLVGLLVHAALSILFALLIAIIIHRWGLRVGVIGGALLGAALYGINLYTFTVFFQWFFAINSPVLLISHIVYGAVVGGVYESMDRFDVKGTV